MSTATPPTQHFIRQIVEQDLASGRHRGVVTRFPPEPNGYLHVGHAKSICLNFGLARDFQGRCHLRFDDTNPAREDQEYIDAIQEDVRWLGFDWGEHLHHASDYFEPLYECAVELIRRGLAYVDDQTPDQIRERRGTLTEPGRDSPFRGRSVEENLDLFARMRAGEFPDGARVLRARIDMAHPNMVMRDPTLYRIRHEAHPVTGAAWCIYPMYDFTHCLSDSFEEITHSLCTLEFENHRPLYDWVLEALERPCHPQQIEFARLNLEYTVMSKRRLLQLVREGHVSGWDDPRMPTLAGMRRRGYPPAALRAFCERIGVSKAESWIPFGVLEEEVRHELNTTAPRVMGVLRPLRVVIEDYPEGQVERFEAPYYPDDPSQMGAREVPFSRVIYIEREDFMEVPAPKFFRLAPGREVRLRRAYLIRCTGVVKDEAGEVVEVRCTYDPESRGGNPADGRRVKGTLHWVSEAHSIPAEVRLYDRLFSVERPGSREGVDLLEELNPGSLEVLTEARLEPSLAQVEVGARMQLERLGFFVVDQTSQPGRPVLNRIVALKDSWARIAGKA